MHGCAEVDLLPIHPLMQLQGHHVEGSDLQNPGHLSRLMRSAADKGAKSSSCLLAVWEVQARHGQHNCRSRERPCNSQLLNTHDRTGVQLLPLATALFRAITELIPVFIPTVAPPWQTSRNCCIYCIADWSQESQASAEKPTGWADIKDWRLWAQSPTAPSSSTGSHYEGFINPAFGWSRALPKALCSNGKIVYKGSHYKFFKWTVCLKKRSSLLNFHKVETMGIKMLSST